MANACGVSGEITVAQPQYRIEVNTSKALRKIRQSIVFHVFAQCVVIVADLSTTMQEQGLEQRGRRREP
jgi:hypothetical protein